jgi:VanZ family protein
MKWLTLIFILVIIAMVVAADLGRLPRLIDVLIYETHYGDKIGHFVLMGVLSFLVNASALSTFPRRNPGRIILITSLVLAAIVGAEEFSQRYFPKRTSSLADLAFSYAGILVFAGLAWLYKGRR